MTATLSPNPVQPQFLDRLGKLRDVFELLGLLRDLREPLASPDGLHGLTEVLLNLAELVGLDAELIARVRRWLDDPRLFELLLAVARFVAAMFQKPRAA